MNNKLKKEILEEFDRKWKRMRENGFGSKVSLDGRMIWSVDDDEEDSYVFADETIKKFLAHTIDQVRQEERDRIIVMLDKNFKEKVEEEGYAAGFNDALIEIKLAIHREQINQ